MDPPAKKLVIQKNFIHIRPVHRDDLPAINNLLCILNYNVGLHILELYFLNSAQIWQVAVSENGEIVGFDCTHEMVLEKIQFTFNMLVRDDHRNMGVLKKFNTVY